MLYLITNRNLCRQEDYINIIKLSSYSGVDRVILREKDLEDEKLEHLYLKLLKQINPNCKIIINSNIYVAEKHNAYGLHLPFDTFLNYHGYFQGEIGVSVHSVEEGIIACNKGASYILASHIFNTKCKAGLEPKGLEFLRELKRKTTCPIVALGGIYPNNVIEVLKAGATSVAVMSSIMASQQVQDIIKEYKANLY